MNIRDKAGKQQLLGLVQTADVLIEQFRPGAMASWGLSYADLKTVNPKLIYVSLTGYGQTGPMANAAGHDLNYMALSGLLSQHKDTQGKPIIPGVQWADIDSGSYQTIQAILAALLYRSNSGDGQYIDISMTDGLLPIATIAFNQMWATGSTPKNSTESLSGLLPNYNVYETLDGKWMALGALEPKFWERFCEILGQNEWREKCIPGHAELEQTKQEVATLFKQKSQSYWRALGEKEEICLTPVLELNEVEQHPHFKARDSFDYFQSLPQINAPIKFGSSPSQIHWSAPELGEDAL
jgi:alpha-methylacyl-CoA racemase